MPVTLVSEDTESVHASTKVRNHQRQPIASSQDTHDQLGSLQSSTTLAGHWSCQPDFPRVFCTRKGEADNDFLCRSSSCSHQQEGKTRITVPPLSRSA